MTHRAAAAIVLAALLSGCAAPPTSPEAPANVPAAAAAAPAAQDAEAAKKAADEAKQKADEKRSKQKELRDKQRQLAHAAVERQVQEIDRTTRTLTVQAALDRAGVELEVARKELEVFLQDVKPREIEQRRISLDGTTYYAEHQKDELGELTAMYEADEFARSTKELVLKRGRREMELADRRLAVEKREYSHFEQTELPNRERELRHKVADAELAKRKAELEVEKARIELELEARKLTERTADLEEDVRDLQEALAKLEAKS